MRLPEAAGVCGRIANASLTDLRDIKVGIKQTVLGVAWAILQPVVSMVVLTLFFGKLAHLGILEN